MSDYINVRFYYDKESNAVLYTDDSRTYTYEPDSTGYKDSDGNTYDSEYKIACEIDGTMYIAFQYVADYTNCTYGQQGYSEERYVYTIQRRHQK